MNGINAWENVVSNFEQRSKGWRSLLPKKNIVVLRDGSSCSIDKFLFSVKVILQLWKNRQQNTIDALACLSTCEDDMDISGYFELTLIFPERQSLLATGLVEGASLRIPADLRPLGFSLVGGGIDSFVGMNEPWPKIC